LTLEEVYGALAFYLGHTKEIDAYLAEADAAFASQARELNAAARARNPRLFERLRDKRRPRETPSQL
jgi:hypothetical protein